MNRSTIYEYLRNDTDLKIRTERFGRGQFPVLYIPYDWDYSFLHINTLRITNFREVILFSSELVVRFTNLDDWQINIPYKDIDYIAVANDEYYGYIGLQDGEKVQR